MEDDGSAGEGVTKVVSGQFSGDSERKFAVLLILGNAECCLLGTRKELFNNALTLFQWAVKTKRAGRIIAAIEEDCNTIKEIVLPTLEVVTPANKKSLSPQ